MIETSKTSEAIAARDRVADEAKAAGAVCVLTMKVREGRAPAGFKKAISEQYYYPVGL